MKLYNISVDLFDKVSGMDAISIVDMPAVEVDFLCFGKDTPNHMKFDSEKHIISGVVALADTPIYRWSPKMGDYYVQFSKDVIETMILKYSMNNLNNKVNLDHDDSRFVDSVFMIESYIKNSERGIVPVEFKDIPDGSWICSFKVMDDELWDEIKTSGKFNGFSLQGMFDLEPANFNKEQTIDDLIDELINTNR